MHYVLCNRRFIYLISSIKYKQRRLSASRLLKLQGRRLGRRTPFWRLDRSSRVHERDSTQSSRAAAISFAGRSLTRQNDGSCLESKSQDCLRFTFNVQFLRLSCSQRALGSLRFPTHSFPTFSVTCRIAQRENEVELLDRVHDIVRSKSEHLREAKDKIR